MENASTCAFLVTLCIALVYATENVRPMSSRKGAGIQQKSVTQGDGDSRTPFGGGGLAASRGMDDAQQKLTFSPGEGVRKEESSEGDYLKQDRGNFHFSQGNGHPLHNSPNSIRSEMNRHEDGKQLQRNNVFKASIVANDRVACTGRAALSWKRYTGDIHTVYIEVSLSVAYSSAVTHADRDIAIDVPVILNFGDGSELLRSIPMQIAGTSAENNGVYLRGDVFHRYKFLSSKDSFVASMQVSCQNSLQSSSATKTSLQLNTRVEVAGSGSPTPPPMPAVHLYQSSEWQTFTVRSVSLDGHPLLYELGELKSMEAIDNTGAADAMKLGITTGDISVQTGRVTAGRWNLHVLIEDAVTGSQSAMQVLLHIHAAEKDKKPPTFQPSSHLPQEHYTCIGEEVQLSSDILSYVTGKLVISPLMTLPTGLEISSAGKTTDEKQSHEISLQWKPKSAGHFSVCFTAADISGMSTVPQCIFINVLASCQTKAPVVDLNGPESTGCNYRATYTPGKVHAVPITSSFVAIETDITLQHMSVMLGGVIDQGSEILVTAPDCYLDDKLRHRHGNQLTVLFWEGNAQAHAYNKVLSCLRYVHTLSNGPTAGKRSVLITVKSTHGLSSRALTEIDVLLPQADVSLECQVVATAGHLISVFSSHTVSSLLPESLPIANLTLTLNNALDGQNERLQIIPETYFSGLSMTWQRTNHRLILSETAPYKFYHEILKNLKYENKAKEPNVAERFISFEIYTTHHLIHKYDKVCQIRVQTSSNRFRRGASSVSVTFTEEMGPVSIPVDDLGVLDGYIDVPVYVEVSLTNRPNHDEEILQVQSVQEEQTFTVDGRQIQAVVTYTPVVDFTNGVLNISGLETVKEYEAVLRTLTYENLNTEPNDEMRSVTILVHDGRNFSAPKTVNINFEMVNDSPYFNSNDRPTPSTLEDAGPATQVPMTTLQLAGSIMDDEDGDTLGIAVIGVDNSHGKWEYLDFPGTWTEINVPGKIQPDGSIHRNVTLDNLAMVLTNDWSNFIRFIPQPDWYGTAYISFVAWDGSGETANLSDGDFINATSVNDTDPFSDEAVTIALEIYPVNDSPVLDPSVRTQLTSIQEDFTSSDGDSVQLLLSNCSDVDITRDEETLGVAIIDADLNNGQWQYSLDDGVTWTDISPVTATSALLLGHSGNRINHRIRFQPDPDWNGVATLAFKAWDFSNNLTAGTSQVDTTTFSATEGPYSISEGTAVIEVEPVNDSPVLKPGSAFPPVREDVVSLTGTVVIQLILFTWSDVDVGDVPGVAVVATDNRYGYWQYTCDGSYPFIWVNFTGSYYKGQLIFQTPNFEAATLLSATCRVRFLPEANFNTQYDGDGNSRPADDMPYITIIAWDHSGDTGTLNGHYGVDVSGHAGDPHNPYSSESYNITLLIQSSNDRPILKVGGTDAENYETTFRENSSPVSIVADELILYDVDSSRVRYLTVSIDYDFASVCGLGFPDVMDCEGTTDASNAFEQLHYNLSDTPLEATVQSWCPYEVKFSEDGTESFIVDIISVMKSLQYANTKQEPHPADRIISFKVRDTYTYSYAVQTTVHIQLENDIPVLAINSAGDALSSVTYTEGQGTLEILPELQLTDHDNPYMVNATIILTSYDEGYDVLAVNIEGTSINETFKDGELTLYGADTVANYSEVMRSLTYTNFGQDLADVEKTITVNVNDGEANAEAVECHLSYISVNNPPILEPIPVYLDPMQEDDKNSPGKPVVDLLVHASDVDSTVLGVAILYSDNRNGIWQYTLDGENWINIQVAGITDGLLLTSIPENEHRVRFLPNEDFHGESHMFFKAWDLTSNYINEATNIDLSGYDPIAGSLSINDTSAVIRVESVNDSPVLLSGGMLPEIQEDTEPDHNFGRKVGDMMKDKYFDKDGDPVGIAVIGVDNRHGYWQYSCNNTEPPQWVDFIGDIMYGKVVPETPVPEKATLLSAECSVRFQPQKNFNTEYDLSGSERSSSDVPTITILAWDNSGEEIGKIGCYGQDTTSNKMDNSEFSADAFNFTVTVKSVNDPPILMRTYQNSETVFMENGPAVHIVNPSTVEFIDVDDSHLQYMMVSIDNVADGDSESLLVQTSDLLNVSNSHVTVIYNTAEEGMKTSNVSISLQKHTNTTVVGKTTLTFTAAESCDGIPIHACEVILGHILYHNSEDEPVNMTRNITIKISDKENTTSHTIPLTIQLIADHAPEVVIQTTRLNFTEGDSGISLFKDLQLSDLDDNEYFYMSSAEVLISPPLRDLSWEYVTITDHAGAFLVTFDPESGVIMIEGRASVQYYQQALGSIAYRNHMDEPIPTTKNITLMVTDMDGFQSNVVVVELSILVVNDQTPVISTGADVIFVEDKDTIVLISENLIISDADSGNLPIYEVSISIENAYDDGYEAVLVTAVSGEITQQYQPDTHTLILRGPASVADFQQVLASLAYTNAAEEPTPGVHHIRITASDGDHVSHPAVISVDIQSVNDKPVLDLDLLTSGENLTLSYAENTGSMQVLSDQTFQLLDHDNTNLQYALVILENPIDGDSETLHVLPTGTNIAIHDFTDNKTGFNMTGEDSIESYRQMLLSLQYENTNRNASTEQRVIQLQVCDGLATSNAYVFIDIMVVDDPPIIDLNGASDGVGHDVNFIEEGDAVSLTTEYCTVQDYDSDRLFSAVIEITNSVDGIMEEISADTGLAAQLGLSCIYDSSGSQLNITGVQTAASYQLVFRSLTYINHADEPDPETRVVKFLAFDGTNYSTPVYTSVSVTLTNDAPVLQIADEAENSSTYHTIFTEGGNPVAVVETEHLIMTDADDTNLKQLLVHIDEVQDQRSETLFFDLISLPSHINLTKILSVADLSMMNSKTCPPSLDRTSILIDYEFTLEEGTEILKSLRYCNRDRNSTAGERKIRISMMDLQHAWSNICHSYVDVMSVNDPPALTTPFETVNKIKEDHNLTIPVLMHFTDQEEILTADSVRVTAFPEHGTVTVSDDGIGFYPESNDFGNYTITFEVCDSANDCSVLTEVNVEVQSVNDPPVLLEPLQVIQDEDQSIIIDLKQFVYDYEDDSLQDRIYPIITKVTGPHRGTRALSTDNRYVVFTPDVNFHGEDSIAVSYCDSDGACLNDVIQIIVKSVNDLPVATIAYPDLDELIQLEEDDEIQIEITVEDVEDSTPGNITILSVGRGKAEHNSVNQSELNAHGTLYQYTTHIEYTPEPDYYGPDSIAFLVCDHDSGCVNGTIHIHVLPINDPPVVGITTLHIHEDQTLAISVPGDLNITDVEETVNYSSIRLIGNASIGRLSNYEMATWTYQPLENYYSDQLDDVVFSISVCDTDALDPKCTDANITIVISPVNDPPVTPSIEASFDEDSVYRIDLSLYVSDVEDGIVDPTKIEIMEPVAWLVNASYDSMTGFVTLMPFQDAFGRDQVAYRACDSEYVCSEDGVIEVEVMNVNDPPIADDFLYQANQDQLQLMSVLDYVHDTEFSYKLESLHVFLIDNKTGQYSGRIKTANGGSVKLLAQKEHTVVTYEPKEGYIGPDHFRYAVCDQCNEMLEVVALTDTSCIKQVEEHDGSSTWSDGKHIACDHGTVEVLVLNSNEKPVLKDISAMTVRPASVFLTPFREHFSGFTTESMGVYDPDDIQAALLLSGGEDLQKYHLLNNTDINITSTAVVTQPNLGSVTIVSSENSLPQFLYTPSNDNHGYDSFVFQICDTQTEWQQSKCSWATARIHVMVPGPNISAVMASPAEETVQQLSIHTDCKFSRQDTITIKFDSATSMPPYRNTETELTARDLNALFEFADPFITENRNSNPYTGRWVHPDQLVITIIDEGYPQPDVEIGKWFITVKEQFPCGGFDEYSNQPLPPDMWSQNCLTSEGFGSAHSVSISPPLQGSWGYHIPTVKDIIIRNDKVPMVKLRENSDYFGENSELVLSLWPPLSYNQLLVLCKLEPDEVLDLSEFGQGAELMKANCENVIPGEADEESQVSSITATRKRSADRQANRQPHLKASDKETRYWTDSIYNRLRRSSEGNDSSTVMPVFTELVFEITKMSEQLLGPEADRENFIKTISSSVRTEKIADIVSTLTGMIQRDVLNYTTDVVIPSETAKLYQEYLSGQTPQVISVTASDPDNLDLEFSDGDVITVEFDRNTNSPPVQTKADIDRILKFDTSLGLHYSGHWKTAKKLEITITDSAYHNHEKRELQNISFTFTHNILYSGQEFTGQYPYLPTTRPNCVGVNVCGGNSSSLTVGICSEDGLSCRATGTYYISDGNFGVGKLDHSLWWIALALLGCAFLLAVVFTCMYCHTKKKMAQKGEVNGKIQHSRTNEDPWRPGQTQKSHKEGQAGPGLIPPMILFKHQSKRHKVVDDVSKTEYAKHRVNVHSRTPVHRHKHEEKDSPDLSVSAIFPDLGTALLLQPTYGQKDQADLKDETSIDPHSPSNPKTTDQPGPLVRHSSEIDMSVLSNDDSVIPYDKTWHQQSVGQPPPDMEPTQVSLSKRNAKSMRQTDPLQEALLNGHHNGHHNSSNESIGNTSVGATHQPPGMGRGTPAHIRSSSVPLTANTVTSEPAVADVAATDLTEDANQRNLMQNHLWEPKIASLRPDKIGNGYSVFAKDLDIEKEAKKREQVKGKLDTGLYPLDTYELASINRGTVNGHAMYNSADSLHNILTRNARRNDTSKF
ncbi:uncharacterized protein [Ptychodera flava]|uniref:uncharacterized protein n=1 Tax=Ptychodera flava TaxID=63121 RepID=UPI00396A61BA